MSAIPDSRLPGHEHLHSRVVSALDLCQESPGVEFKTAAAWDAYKYHLVRAALAMSNRRDGGIIVIGVSERDGQWLLNGIGDADLASYVEDDINDFINKYASPPIRVELLSVVHREKCFLAVRIPEFPASPIICRRNGPDGDALREGAIFVRTSGKPQTTRAVNADQIAELLALAAEKGARVLIASGLSAGLVHPRAMTDEYDDEAKTLLSDEPVMPVPLTRFPYWRVIIRPGIYNRERIGSISGCVSLVERYAVRLRGWSFPYLSTGREALELGSNSIGFSVNILGRIEYWRLYQSSQLVYFSAVPERSMPDWDAKLRHESRHHIGRFADVPPDRIPGFLSVGNLLYSMTEFFLFAGRLSSGGIYDGAVTIRISLHGAQGYVLTTDQRHAWWLDYACSDPYLDHSWAIPAAELALNAPEKSIDAAIWFYQRFGWLDPAVDVLRAEQDKLLSGR